MLYVRYSWSDVKNFFSRKFNTARNVENDRYFESSLCPNGLPENSDFWVATSTDQDLSNAVSHDPIGSSSEAEDGLEEKSGQNFLH